MKRINFNKILYIFMIILVILFMMFLYSANILPFKYYICVLIIMLLWLIALYFLLVFKTERGKNKKRKIIGYIFSIFLIILMLLIFYYVSVTLGFFKGFGKNKYMEEKYLVLVLNDSDYNEISDLSNIGYISNELTNIDDAVTKLNEIVTITNNKYDKYDTLFNDLVNKNIDSILIEESYLSIIEENNKYDDLFKTIYTFSLKIEIEEVFNEIDVTKDAFTIFISGIDSYGKITTTARSDVNMVATVNPVTKQILLISIPRDYYVRLSGTTGYKDKLTHAGIYGIDTSVKTVEELLSEDINYYFRVNFSSLQNIVDAIGGIDVYSKYTFVSTGGYQFYEGYNHLNGEQALAFSRERYHLPYGDISRNENQRAVIDGLIRKATSGAIITRYSSILNSLVDSFQTNMNEKDIQKLIKMQLNDMASWNITSYGLTGTDGYEYTYSYQDGHLYVMYPLEDSVNEVKTLIDKVVSGELLKSSYDKDASNIKNPTVVQPSEEPTPDDSTDETNQDVSDENEQTDQDISDETADDEVNEDQNQDNDVDDSQEESPLEPPLDDIIDVGDEDTTNETNQDILDESNATEQPNQDISNETVEDEQINE